MPGGAVFEWQPVTRATVDKSSSQTIVVVSDRNRKGHLLQIRLLSLSARPHAEFSVAGMSHADEEPKGLLTRCVWYTLLDYICMFVYI